MAIEQVWIITLLFGLSAGRSHECPPLESIPGCRCSYTHNMLGLECRGDKSGKTIEDFRDMLLDNKVNTKTISGLNFFVEKESKLTSRIFEGFHIKALNFWYSHISRWADEEGGPAFVGLEDTLERLNIHDSIRKDPSVSHKDDKAVMTLGHLRKLRRVDFYLNDIYNFGNDWFGDGGSSIDVLTVDRSRIYYIGDRAFAALTNLKQIEIYGNAIKTVVRSMFPNPATHLQQIHLMKNELESLPEDIFTNMPSLVDVNLRENHIAHLPESIWRPVWSKLISLDINENPLKCDDNINWVFKERTPKYLKGKCYISKNSTYVILHEFIKEKQLEEN